MTERTWVRSRGAVARDGAAARRETTGISRRFSRATNSRRVVQSDAAAAARNSDAAIVSIMTRHEWTVRHARLQGTRPAAGYVSPPISRGEFV
jgi:hypothetical protein